MPVGLNRLDAGNSVWSTAAAYHELQACSKLLALFEELFVVPDSCGGCWVDGGFVAACVPPPPNTSHHFGDTLIRSRAVVTHHLREAGLALLGFLLCAYLLIADMDASVGFGDGTGHGNTNPSSPDIRKPRFPDVANDQICS